MQASPAPTRGPHFTLRVWPILPLALGLLLPAAPAQDDPFADFIRKTDPLTPAEAQRSFHLPPGFEIQLVAAEPDIGKPMNIAFDERGRLWLTQSREYPFAAPTNQPGRDEIKILADFDESGRARRLTTFADGLNIPIGIYPWRGGAIAFSIPAIYHFEDRDGDGRADERTLLYSGQGYDLDTHGLTSGFRRGYDGWLYACHGYRNTSRIRGKDGHVINMNSGNSYRMRLDGVRVEQFTWGQVNPFGLQFDPRSDLFSADCHSSPVYLLLRGAYYPSFGKPHDGLGFGPNICAHTHGSTAIAGIALYHDDQFPPEYRGNAYLGNVMTCRLNRDSFIEQGSTPIAKEEPDFLRSDDPWFRPVDITLGPDGALYVADFYNRIIGHYEVPLDHPGRDRERGRIWRIVYRGDRKKLPLPQEFDLSKSNPAALIEKLAHANLTVRMLAMDQLVDRIGQAAIPPVERLFADRSATANQRIHGLWVLHRLGALTQNHLAAAARDGDPTVRIHAMRALSESPDWTAAHRELALACLRDADPYVQRAAADAVGRQPHSEHVRPLLDARHHASAADSALVHTIRMALRNQLQADGAFARLASLTLKDDEVRVVADVSLGLPSTEAGAFILQQIEKISGARELLMNYLRHAARHAPEPSLAALPDVAKARFGDDVDSQFLLFRAAQEGLAQRGAAIGTALQAWAGNLAENLLAPVDEARTPWVSLLLDPASQSASPWRLEQRASADGDRTAWYLSSLPAGENLTGILRSRAFAIPPQLSFFLAGHDGYPDQPLPQKNFIRLLAADNGEVLARAAPPRNDTAQRVVWDLRQHTNRRGVLEVVDGNTGEGFAWLAVGRFEPAVLPLPNRIPDPPGRRQQNAAELARTVPLPDLTPQLARLFADASSSLEARAAAANALVALDPKTFTPVLARNLDNTNQPALFREKVAVVLSELNESQAREAVLRALLIAPFRTQLRLAQALARHPAGAAALLDLVEARRLSVQLLLDRQVKDRLAAARLPDFSGRYERLTSGQSPASAELQKLLQTRLAGFDPATASARRGALVFEKNCAVCHQMGGQGVVVGPQLDGVGTRGLERLIEDVLDANRNVDPEFRVSNVTLKDDTAVTGLLRREEGEVLVFADTTGKEIAVRKSEIAERRESELSLMPSNFGDVLSVEEFNDLIAFLLSPVGR